MCRLDRHIHLLAEKSEDIVVQVWLDKDSRGADRRDFNSEIQQKNSSMELAVI